MVTLQIMSRVLGLEKTAVKLINEYGSLEKSLENANEVKNKRAREGLLNASEAIEQELLQLIPI